ncbi:MAG: fumarate reductase subunit C [Pseudomonadota bacterium]
MARRPYVREVNPVTWWVSDPHFNRWFYVDYMLRESTCIAIALYTILFVWGLGALASGPEAFSGFMGAMQSTVGVIIQLILLALTVYHTVTWFKLAPQGMKPIRMGGQKVPAQTVVKAHYAIWAGVTVVTLIIVAVLAP